LARNNNKDWVYRTLHDKRRNKKIEQIDLKLNYFLKYRRQSQAIDEE